MVRPPIKGVQHTPTATQGAPGGDARVDGHSSEAIGGDAGQSVIGPGGRGGHAIVRGNNSRAIGGRGGRGGLGPGGNGGDALATGDNSVSFGGDGGEANQADGRGGRGGMPNVHALAAMVEDFGVVLDISRVHMRAPYWVPNTIPGSGGHGADSIQHKARRLILEELKVRYFADHGRSVDRVEVWYDREVVPLDWLNLRLQTDGHAWSVSVVDHEYEFSDGTINGLPAQRG